MLFTKIRFYFQSLSVISSEKDESEMTVEEKKELQKKRFEV